MKKLLLIITLSLLLSGCGIFNLNGFIVPDDLEFLAVIENLRTPQEISDYMMRNFTYELHSLYAPDPYTLWLTKKGDCNDFSSFSTWVADYHGYETWQIQIFYLIDPLWRHWIAIYKEDNLYNFTDNQYYFPINVTSFREIVNYNSDYLTGKTWVKYIVYDYEMNIIEIREL